MANAIWNGVISFGLLNIPVALRSGERSTDLHFRMLDSLNLSINVASFIGHNNVRQAVLGTSSREPNPEEIKKMEDLVEKGMQDGAVGFST